MAQDITELCTVTVDSAHVFIGPLDSWNTLAYLDIFLTLDLPNEARRTYEHSKLYYALNSRHDFSEERVVTFRIPYLSEPQRLRVKLPENLRSSSSVKFRLDPAPGSHCHCVIHRICIAEREDQADLTTAADLDCLKERTRRAVYESEVIQRAECPHHPESLNLEITARCNLTCTHCSSHGTKELHTAHNTMPEFRRDLLQKLAAEVFPSLTSVLLVGRGEPLAVTDSLWLELVDSCVRNRVFLACTTNASYLDRRIHASLLPWIDRLTISIDGFSLATFAANRGGDNLHQVLDRVAFFHDMRQKTALARRPRLCLSWTLKKNNVREFIDFARFAVAMEADSVYVRHLLVFHEKDRDQSVLDCPAEIEGYLREAYELLDTHQIPKDCPPLVGSVVDEDSTHTDITGTVGKALLTPDNRCLYFHKTATIHHTGEVFTCSLPSPREWVHLRTVRASANYGTAC